MRIGKDKIVWIIMALLVWFGLYSCKTMEMTTRIDPKDISVKDISSAAVKRSDCIPGIWVKKIRGTIHNENIELSFKANYRIKRDSVIIISILNPVGIEAIRILCIPDSIGFIDRINREYYYGTYEVLKKKIGYQMNFGLVQSLLLNEIATVYKETKDNFFKKYRKLNVNNNHGSVSLDELNRDGYGIAKIRYDLDFDPINYYLVRNRITDDKEKNEIDIVYKNFMEVEQTWFPGLINASIKNGRNQITCSLDLERITIGTDFNTNFSIGQKYKKIDW